VAAPAKVEKTKAPKAAKAEAAPAPAAAVAEPVAEAEGATDGSVLLKSIDELSEQLSGLKATLQTALLGLKTLEKQAARVVKKADRRGRRKAEAVEGAPKKPCIFTQPVKISEELCSFLALPKASEVSRSAVTKAVMAYARNHNLMEKQTIKADAPLRKLLSLKDSDPQLTILNLQTYLSRHYVKAVPVAK
jgi:chromatin remodeling complex protein RSC6